jgi:mono/diheme cytochrome c family protein
MTLRRLASLWLLPASLLAGPTADDAPVFEKDVLPIFSTYCFTCHGKSSPELGVDLRTAASVLRGSFNGPVVEKGAPEKSRLYLKVSKHEMPPPAFESVVPDADVAVIRRWIETGAQSNAADEIPESAKRQIARFEHEVQPILEARCVACHGETPQSGLDLRTLAAVLRGGEHGPVLEEGFSDKSILIRQIEAGEMPPKGVGEPLTRAEIDRIRDWVDVGGFADYVDKGNPLDRAFTEAEAPEITAEDRQSWAFQKPVAHDPPRVTSRDRVRSPIDAFVLAKLEAQGLALSAEASRRALLRRAYFDLWGVPPTPEETAQFLGDTRPDAYERLLDRLLASPRYGQRWGRFWLDAAGYVDTAGKDFQSENVSVAPGMWRYRDYVIESFNEDKPWDRFLTEQLAGDELYEFRAAAKYTPEMLEALIATGYLRTQLDATDEDISDRPADRYDAIFAMLDKVSASALGLTLTCARCHSHKFDPIPQRDYYRFLALFSSAYNPSAWIQPKKRLMYTVAEPERKEIEEHNKSIDAETKKLETQIAEIRDPYLKRLRAKKLEAAPQEVRSDLAAALDTAAKERDAVQKYLVEKFGKLAKVSDGEVDAALSAEHRDEVSSLRKDLETWTGYRRELNPIRALWDGEEPPAIRLLQRGSVEAPGPRVSPGFLSILCAPGDDCTAHPSSHRVGSTSGYRLALAEWLTSPDQPLTARVIVNRLWQGHFGAGIVATADNFGEMGSGASHPELLDWLAVDFVKNGWKAKRLHKQIMLSSVYRQSSNRGDNPSAERASTADPDNRLLWRAPLRRLEAEALRDSILAVAGRLDDSLGGPPVELTARPDGLQLAGDDGPTARRSVYLLARRTWPATFLSVFDFPNIDTTCTRRTPSATPLQSLTLMNSEFLLRNARATAERLGSPEAPPDELVRRAYEILFARPPSDAERALALTHLGEQASLYTKANASESQAREHALENLVHMLMSTDEFLYVD